MQRAVIICFLITLLVSITVNAETIDIRLSPEEICLNIQLPEDIDFKVWHTTSPMKVIIDIENYSLPAFTQQLEDVAVNILRAAPMPSKTGTRIVMDFNYPLPEPTWHKKGDILKVTVDKVFVRQSVSLVSQGVRYGHQRRASLAGPLIVNYLEVDITNPEVELKAVLAQDQVFGKEFVSSMAKRSQAISAVNGLYFAPNGRPLGILAIDGRLVSEPYANRTAIALGDKKATIEKVDFSGKVITANGDSMDITGMNRPRLADDLIVYTSDYGATSETNQYGIDIVLKNNQVVDKNAGSTIIPSDGVVISGHGLARNFLRDLEVGDYLQWEIELAPDLLREGFNDIIGGGPRLVKSGEVYITGQQELFQQDILNGRAPRTALGITADEKLLLVTVNGRNPNISVGMSLEELAKLMIELGAVDAMNLDGGGSTTMVIRDRVLNLPSDGIERLVSNALAVITSESRR